MGGDNNRDLPQEVKPSDFSTDNPVDKLRDEGHQGMSDLSRQQTDSKATASTKVASHFGDLQITGFDQRVSSPAKIDTSSFTDALGDQPKDAPPPAQKDTVAEKKTKTPEEKAADAAAELQHQALHRLEEGHKNLKVTTDGSPARAIDYQDKFTVNAEKSAMDIAKEQLGPNATQDQLKHYAGVLKDINGKQEKTVDDARFGAGSVIRLPGETTDGGVVTKDAGGTTDTRWYDNSSFTTKEDGAGRANLTNPDGTHSEFTWDPENSRWTMEQRSDTKTDTQWETNSNGRTTESKYVAKNKADGDWQTTRVTAHDEKGTTYDYEFDPPGSRMAKKATITKADKTQIELTPSKDGTYVSADGKTGLTGDGDLFARNLAADGSVTRTYEDNTTENYDARNRIVQRNSKDSFGRDVEYDFKPGSKQPDSVKVTVNPGEKPVELKHHGNKYTADYLDPDGKKIGTIELGRGDRLIYNDDKNKTVHTQTNDGTTIDVTKGADGTKTVSVKGSESFVSETDKKGHLKYDTFTGNDGSKLTKNYSADGKHVDSIKVEDAKGGTTELKYDDMAQAYVGQKKDASGKVIENVTNLEDKLVFTDVNTGAVRAEKFSPPNADTAVPHMLKGEYDKNSGTFTYENDKHQKVVESFSPGIKDVMGADGTLTGSTTRGDKSTVKPDGEAKVMHSDGTGVRLNADGTIDRWGPNESINKEKLSAGEDKYLKGHTDLDRRDLAEIHRRFGGDTQKLDSFYGQLEKVDTANNLNDAEKAALRKDILHHVANPQEIYQGHSPSCNVTVIERDMAINTPDKYAQTIVSAVSDGKFTTANGTQVPLDTANLKLADSSGRDLASRIFQTTTLQAEVYPGREYRNTEDGVGRLYPAPFNPADQPTKFEGLSFPNIADARYKMTGEREAMTAVQSVDDLVTAFEANGGKPMIVAVDGHHPPFNEGGPLGSGKLNHVVTVTAIDKRAHPPKVYFENQWGLKADHSTPQTTVDAKVLLKNMKAGKKVAMVLSTGDYNKLYDIEHGKVVEVKEGAAVLAKAQQVLPGDEKKKK